MRAVGGGGTGEWATVAQARSVGGERRAGGCTSGDGGCASGSGPRGMGAAHRVGGGQECPRVLVGWTHGLLVCYVLTWAAIGLIRYCLGISVYLGPVPKVTL